MSKSSPESGSAEPEVARGTPLPGVQGEISAGGREDVRKSLTGGGEGPLANCH